MMARDQVKHMSRCVVHCCVTHVRTVIVRVLWCESCRQVSVPFQEWKGHVVVSRMWCDI